MKFEFPAKNDDSLHKSNQTSLKQNELSSKKSLQLNYSKNHLQPLFFLLRYQQQRGVTRNLSP